MTIPPNKLRESLLPFPETLLLRTSEGKADSNISYTDALAAAFRGEIEAVCSAGGRIRFFRMLRMEERPDAMDRAEVSLDDAGRSTAFCNPNIGVYEQALGNPVTCYTWAHCGCRAFDGAR